MGDNEKRNARNAVLCDPEGVEGIARSGALNIYYVRRFCGRIRDVNLTSWFLLRLLPVDTHSMQDDENRILRPVQCTRRDFILAYD